MVHRTDTHTNPYFYCGLGVSGCGEIKTRRVGIVDGAIFLQELSRKKTPSQTNASITRLIRTSRILLLRCLAKEAVICPRRLSTEPLKWIQIKFLGNGNKGPGRLFTISVNQIKEKLCTSSEFEHSL